MNECLELCNIALAKEGRISSFPTELGCISCLEKKNLKHFSLGKPLSHSHYRFITGPHISMAIIFVNVFNLKFIMEMLNSPFSLHSYINTGYFSFPLPFLFWNKFFFPLSVPRGYWSCGPWQLTLLYSWLFSYSVDFFVCIQALESQAKIRHISFCPYGFVLRARAVCCITGGIFCLCFWLFNSLGG